MIDDTPSSLQSMLADIMGAKGITNCPPQIAIDALRKTAIDFCTQSTIWQYTNGFDTQYNVADYPIFTPEGSRLASMRWVAVDGYILRPNTTGYMPYRQGPLSTFDPNSFFTYQGNGFTFTMDERRGFSITPVPLNSSCCQHVDYCMALKPTQNACELPRILTEDWNDALASGTAYRLFSIPKQDWSNAGLAMVNSREYSRWIARARLVKMQNYTQAPGVMTGAYF